MKKKMQGKSQDKVELLQTRSELDETQVWTKTALFFVFAK